MMSELTRKRDEVAGLYERYMLYRDCDEDFRRRKVHIDLDKFLMENRELAIMCIDQVLNEEIEALRRETDTTQLSWFQRITAKFQRRHAKGGFVNVGTSTQQNTTTRDA